MNKIGKTDSEIFVLTEEYALLGDFFPIPDDRTVELDLGCGMGDLALGIAERFPKRLILAADVMLGRLRKVERKAVRRELENLNLLRVEARHLVSLMLPDASLNRIHILCPDPWPKKRHAGHRLLSADFMMQISRVLRPGGIFHFSTDDVPYRASTRKNVAESGLFEEVSAEFIADVADIKTGFERQWLEEGKEVPHVAWRKK